MIVIQMYANKRLHKCPAYLKLRSIASRKLRSIAKFKNGYNQTEIGGQ